MKALITGANGMLGDSLCSELRRRKYNFVATDIIRDRPDVVYLDIRDKAGIERVFGKFKPDIVFHLAALTDVDKCQQQKDEAFITNTFGTENIALACMENDIVMVYASTGAVFDGTKTDPYNEFDKPHPVNIYGASKLEGEKAVQRLLRKYFIVRSGWLIGGIEKDKKFVAKIIKQLKTQKEILAVTDKIGSPTFTKDLAEGLMDLVETERYGLYHMANKGVCSRYTVAKKVVELMKKGDANVIPVTSKAFILPAPRPNSEAIENFKLNLLGIDGMRFWEQALEEYISIIIKTKKTT